MDENPSILKIHVYVHMWTKQPLVETSTQSYMTKMTKIFVILSDYPQSK